MSPVCYIGARSERWKSYFEGGHPNGFNSSSGISRKMNSNQGNGSRDAFTNVVVIFLRTVGS